MDFSNLANRKEVLLTHLNQLGYSEMYINTVKKILKYLIEEQNPERWNSYSELLKEMECNTPSKASLKHKKTALNLISNFDLFGVLPGESSPPYFRGGTYKELNNEYKSMIDYYESSADESSKKLSTIRNECANTSSFLLSLQKQGISQLCEISEEAILSILTDEKGNPIRSASYLSQISSVFKGTVKWNSECARIAALLPTIKKHRKNIQYFQAHEKEKIKSLLQSTDTTITYRNKAIGCLLYYTGLRTSDIANLTFDSIDWNREKITIVQQKTGNLVSIPMPVIVGNAIYDYLMHERRKSDEPYIFLSYNKPYKKLSPGSIGMVADKEIYDKAYIRQNKGDRKGGHLFRHNVATSLLENGVSRAVISKTLGHATPRSTDIYLSADMVHLKEYSLSIDAFPIREEVFSNE